MCAVGRQWDKLKKAIEEYKKKYETYYLTDQERETLKRPR